MTIGVFFGGKSPEHDVSIITGQLILAGLKKLGHQAIAIYLNSEGQWHLGEALESIAFFKNQSNLDAFTRWNIDLSASNGKIVFKQKKLWGKIITIDAAFPAFHGQNGEDGTAQGLFELFNIPYVGCGVAASAITMDKALTKSFYEYAGFPTTPFICFHKKDWEKNKEAFINKIKTGLAWPVFVKPARLGSSIGIAKVTRSASSGQARSASSGQTVAHSANSGQTVAHSASSGQEVAHSASSGQAEKDLAFAIDVALHYDDKILVEAGVEPVMDITCAVLGNQEPQASLLQESTFADDLFSYEDKYLRDGGAQTGQATKNIVIPARLDDATTAFIRATAIQVFLKLECSGIARVDFLYDSAAKKAFVNEVNTLPGTLYHHLWEKSGVPFTALLTKLLALAYERHAEKKTLTHSFASDILAQADWSQKLGKKL